MAAAFSRLSAGELAVVPTDTVYGLAAALDSPAGVERLYAVKGRPREQPCQVLLYSTGLLGEAVDGLHPRVGTAVMALLPGTVTCVVDDPNRRFVAAAGDSPGSVGLRVPHMAPGFGDVDGPLVATSANTPGGPEPAVVGDVSAELRAAAGAVLDAGRLPGVASSVVDLRPVGRGESARLLRPGPNAEAVRLTLDAVSVGLVGGDAPG